MITGAGDILDNVGGENHDPVTRQFHKQVPEADSFPRVESRRGFIYHEDARQVEQRLGNTYTLFHTTGESPDFLILVLVHVNGGKHFCDPVLAYTLVVDAFQQSLIFEKFPSREVLVGSEFLRQVTDQTLQLFPFLLGVDTVDKYLAVALLENTADDTHQRGFTRSVGTEESDHSGMDFHGNGT